VSSVQSPFSVIRITELVLICPSAKPEANAGGLNELRRSGLVRVVSHKRSLFNVASHWLLEAGFKVQACVEVPSN
jgi:hypothetical protein